MPRIAPVRAPGREAPSILDALSRMDEGGLAALLSARPDLIDPPPHSLADLAARAAGPGSIYACRQALDQGCHLVHEALCLLPAPATLSALAGLLAVDEADPALADMLGRLADRALISRDGDALRVLPGVEIRYPAGLGPPAAVALAPQSAATLVDCARRLGVKAGGTKTACLAAIAGALSEPGLLSRLLETAPAGTADLARRLASRGPEGGTPGVVYAVARDATPVAWLVNRGVVAQVRWDTVVLVREAGLALRGGVAFPEPALRPPEPTTHPVDATASERTAAERALRLVADVMTILDGWAVDPPRQLKAGGLGIQPVRRVAKAIDRTELEAARIIELAAAAGLVSIDEDSDAALPLPTYDEWLALDVAGRWSHLVAAWIAWDLHPSVAGALDDKRKPIPALLVRAPEPCAAARRSRVLGVLTTAPPGHAVTRDGVFARVLWDAPALWLGGPGSPEMLVSWTLAECELLGVTGLGALSAWGRLAATGDVEGAGAAIGRRVPASTSKFIVQADLTALAPAELLRPVQVELESMADLESRGAATVFRFSETSLGRSFEAGRTAPQIVDFLEEHAAKGVPQALLYLVNDVGRRFGQVRVAATACCLCSDDPSLLAEVVASRAARRLGLRLLAPTVAAAAADPATVLATLRENGYLPAEERPDGTLVLSRPDPRRAVPDPQLAALTERRPGSSAGFGPAGGSFVLGATGLTSGAGAVDDGRSPRAVAARLLRGGNGHLKPKRPMQAPPTTPSPTALPPTRGRAPAAPPGPFASSLFDIGSIDSRPDEIARGLDAVVDLLHEAMVSDWPVRMAYTSKKGHTTQINASVLDVAECDVLVQLLPGWGSRTLATSRIGWARILTEAEEEALA